MMGIKARAQRDVAPSCSQSRGVFATPRRANTRGLLIVLLGAALLGALAPACSSQPPAQVSKPAEPSEQADDYLRDARAELKNDNFSAARAMLELAEQEGAAEAKTRALSAELERARADEAEAAGDFDQAHQRLIRAAEQAEDRELATQDLLRAIDLGEQIGMMSQELAPIASRAAELTVQSAPAQRAAARLWDDAGEPDRALPYYQWLYKTDPENIATTNRMATLMLNQGNIIGARRIFEQVHQAHPDHAVVALKLADIYEKTAKYVSAERIYRDLLEKNPENPSVLDRYIKFLKSRGEYDRARTIEAQMRQNEPPVERRKMRPLR